MASANSKILFCPGEFLDPTGLVKLNTNENPHGLSAVSRRKLAAFLQKNPDIFWRYPDPQSEKLCQQIARFHGLHRDNVRVGGGISEMIPWFCRACLTPETRVTYLLPNYGFYESSLRQSCAQLFPLEAFPHMEPHGILGHPKPPPPIALRHGELPPRLDFLFLTSPNVPTGLPLDADAFRELLRHFRGTVILDEAYGPFGGNDFSSWQREFSNLVIFRTFSKAYGLAGLRCSYMLADASFLEKMAPFQMPYNANAIAQMAASLALQDVATFDKNRREMHQNREEFQEFLKSLGWFFFESQGNFVLFRPEKNGVTGDNIAENLRQFLRENGIILRHFAGHWTGCFLRCSMGTSDEMRQVREAIRAWDHQKEIFH